MRISASSTISHQPTFQKSGFSTRLSALKQSSLLITPDYSDIIPAMDRRRMSEVLKMGVACAVDCLAQGNLTQPDAIVVGTSMGCCTHTRTFLDKIHDSDGGLISPTSFILSTHNTIAGQISLHLKNHRYNMTHTQNSLSFELALMDAALCLKEGLSNVLVGGADELEGGLYNMKAKLNLANVNDACGASFFILSADEVRVPAVDLIGVGSYGLIKELRPTIIDFLKSNGKAAEDIDLILYSGSAQDTCENLKMIFGEKEIVDFQEFSGTWFTNSAFAMAFGRDILLQENQSGSGERITNVLICNNLIAFNLGLILMEYKTPNVETQR